MTATVRSPLAAPIACGCCLLTTAVYVAVDDPSNGGIHLPCPFRSITGWWCPGCGLTRATHHLLRGDLVQALRFHLFVLVVLGAIAASWWSWVRRSMNRPVRVRVPVAAQVAAGVVLVAFGVIRNLPGVTVLRG